MQKLKRDTERKREKWVWGVGREVLTPLKTTCEINQPSGTQ